MFASTRPGSITERKPRQRLDQEQREFQELIARLRAAKDKAEFEQFMADRQMRPPVPQA